MSGNSKMEPNVNEWSGRPTPAMPDDNASGPETVYTQPRPLILAQETGSHTRVRALISNATVNDRALLVGLEVLTAVFGGFTATPAIDGRWNESGLPSLESGLLIEVSFSGDQPVQSAIDIFATIGRDLGKQWVHIEVEHFIARHCKVNP